MSKSENESEICIEEIKRKVFSYHKNHLFFKMNSSLAFLYAFLIFEIQCNATYFSKFAVTTDQRMILDKYLDSIATLIYWIYEEIDQNGALDLNINDKYLDYSFEIFEMARRCSDLRTLFYSNKKEENISIDGERIIFKFSHNNVESVTSVIADSINGKIPIPENETLNKLRESILNLRKNIKIENGKINYELSHDIIEGFKREQTFHWEYDSQFDKYWNAESFEKFSYSSFKKFWIALSTWCYVHQYSFIIYKEVNNRLAENTLLIRHKGEYIKTISNIAEINYLECEEIFDYLTYDSKIKNNDIIFQPLFHLIDDIFLISPHLILRSNAERNLITLLHKKKDEIYFGKLTNFREKIMQNDLNCSIKNSEECIIALNKNIKNMELDYAIYDPKSKNVLLCELKWSNEPDSAAEVISHEEYLQKGCKQIKKIQNYAKSNSDEFMNVIFNIKDKDEIEYSCCVISKNYIRTQDTTVPVLNLNQFINTYNIENGNIENLIKQINERRYLTPLPTNLCDIKEEKAVCKYAGYIFEVPTIYRINLNNYYS